MRRVRTPRGHGSNAICQSSLLRSVKSTPKVRRLNVYMPTENGMGKKTRLGPGLAVYDIRIYARQAYFFYGGLSV